MIDLGHFALVIAWAASCYGIFAGFYGAYTKKQRWIKSAANSVVLAALFAVFSLVALGVAFVNHNYSYAYVWQNSNNDMHPLYLVSAIWGGMDGSMLLWAAIMSVFAGVAVLRDKDVPRELMSWAAPVMSLATNFFLLVVVFFTNPFRVVPNGTNLTDGSGLNPLLQNPSMLIHPPMLYLGFTGFMIPFAFCLAALLSGKLSDRWTVVTRRWTLIAWTFLTAGIILGGNWAYIELGWGGFWAWDPVENASFFPWLTGTAFLHSVMVQQRKGMLKVWNVMLAALSYGLAVFGTFLTRSGIVQSVHAFAETDIGWVFLVYLGILAFITIALVAYRWKELKPESRIESYLSKEAAFLFNNLLFLGICFATFWGVLFPVISEAISGKKSVVGPPFFNQVNVPMFLLLIFLMAVGPLIAWKRTSPKALRRLFLKPLIGSSLITIMCLWLDPQRIGAAVSFGLCFFATWSIFGEFHRAVRVRKEVSKSSSGKGILAVIRRQPRRFGGLIVHLGIVVMCVSITASMVYKIEKDFSLKVGERFAVGRFVLELAELREESLANYHALFARVTVFDTDGKTQIGELNPERRFYPKGEQSTTEVDIRMTPREDLYLALAGLETGGQTNISKSDVGKLGATFKVFVNPLQVWLWFGSMVVIFGSLIVIGPGLRERETVAEPATESVKVSA